LLSLMEVPFVIEVDVEIRLYHSRNLHLFCSAPAFSLLCRSSLSLPTGRGFLKD